MIHYFYNLLFVARGNGHACRYMLDSFYFIMTCFGVTISEEKTEDPVSNIYFLAFEIDTVAIVFHLPKEMFARLFS